MTSLLAAPSTCSELEPLDYAKWRELWDAMMSQYCPAREACFGLALDLLGFLLRGPRLRVLDVCCGSGSFSQRLLQSDDLRAKFERIEIVALDRSPLNLHIARTMQGGEQVDWKRLEADVAWPDDVASGGFDAAFVGWATHEMAPWQVPALYANLARALRPGGLLLNADFMSLRSGFGDVAQSMARNAVTDDWQVLDAEFHQHPDIQDLLQQDAEQRTRWNVWHEPRFHAEALREAGFHDSEEVWRYLSHGMILALR